MRKIVINGTYKHFKGNLYKVIRIAKDCETLKDVVVYESSDGKCWIRDLDVFLSEVDHEKYPDVTQKYRFELVGE